MGGKLTTITITSIMLNKIECQDFLSRYLLIQFKAGSQFFLVCTSMSVQKHARVKLNSVTSYTKKRRSGYQVVLLESSDNLEIQI